MSLRACCGPLVFVVSLLAFTNVRAGAIEEPPVGAAAEAYRNIVAEAIVEHNMGRFAESRALFMRAHELSPSARTLRGLGASEFELRNYCESVRYLEQALGSAVRPLDGDLRERTVKLLERARRFVARLALTVQPTMGVAMVDGVSLPIPDQELMLEVGDHTIEIHAPGYLPARRIVRIRGGESARLHIVLTMQFETAASRAPARDDRRPLYRNPWLWAGVSAVAAGGALALGLSLRSHDRSYDRGSSGTLVDSWR